MKTKMLLTAAAVVMGASAAHATYGGAPSTPTTLGPSVVSTSTKGSLLIFPLITIDPSIAADTTVQISNDAVSGSVTLECKYINEQKARVDFTISLSAKATVSWDVAAAKGDGLTVPPFPGAGPYPAFGSKLTGELICFATTNSSVTGAIAWNHLSGTATVNAVGSAIKYSPYTFRAWASPGVWSKDGDALGYSVSTPYGWTGVLPLDGGLWNSYDAVPAYLETPFVGNGGTVGNVTTQQNYLAVSSAHQDLRLNFDVHTTDLVFNVFNAHEGGLSDGNVCVDSTALISLNDGNPNSVTNVTNFDASSLGTAGGLYDVTGTASDGTTCNKWTFGATENAGLLGVVASYVTVKGGSPALIGGNLYSSTTPAFGYVLYDAGAGIQVKK
jgi:hypothetical protein